MTELMEMTQEKEEGLQENGGQLSAHSGTLPFVRISEAEEHDNKSNPAANSYHNNAVLSMRNSHRSLSKRPSRNSSNSISPSLNINFLSCSTGELGPPKDYVSEEKQPLVSDNEISSQMDPELHKDGRHDMDHCMYNKEILKEPNITSDPNSHLLEHREGFLDRTFIIGPLNLLASAPTPSDIARGYDFCKRITTLQKQQNFAYFSELQRMNVTICQAIFNRTGRSRQELTLDKGDILQVLDSRGDWWKLKNYKGEVGYAPYIMLQVVCGPGIERKPKPYFSRRKHLIVIVISVAIIVFIVIIGVMQIKRPPIV